MALVSQAGKYHAHALKWAVEAQPGKCPQWICEFNLTEVFDPDTAQWMPVEDEQVTWWATLVNKDGALNRNCDALLEAYPDLPDLSPKTLAKEYDFQATEVQLDIQEEEYKGKTKLKVKWLNHRDFEGFSLETHPQSLARMEQDYGSLLRSIKKVAVPLAPKAPAMAAATNGIKDDDIPF